MLILVLFLLITVYIHQFDSNDEYIHGIKLFILMYTNINVAFSASKDKPFLFLVRPTYHLYQSKSGQGKKLRKGKVFLRL